MRTSLLWPSSVRRQAPLPASQIRTAPSSDPEASRVESGEKATDWTPPPWPSSVRRQAPLPASQIRTAPSSDPEASRVESGEKATDWMLRADLQARRKREGLSQ